MAFSNTLNNQAGQVARWSLVAVFFALPISRSLFLVATATAMIAWVLSGQWEQKWLLLKNQRAAFLMVVLIAWIFVSASWSEGTIESIGYSFSVQWQLLLLPIIVTLTDRECWVHRYWNAFATGMAILLAHVVFLNATSMSVPWVHSTDPNGIFFNAIPQSIGLALFAAWCLHQAICRAVSLRLRWLAFAGLMVALYAVLQISPQRLGYAALFLGVSIVIFTNSAPGKRGWALIVVGLMAIGVIAASPKIQARIQLAQQEIQSYGFKNNYSSVGARLHMWYTSINAIKQKPIVGHGLGSYSGIAEKKFNDPAMCGIGCNNPHNQYIFFAVEYGAVGLVLFMAALLSAGWAHRAMQPANAMPLAILAVFMMSSLGFSTLWDRGCIYLFVPLLGLTMIRPSRLQTDTRRASA